MALEAIAAVEQAEAAALARKAEAAQQAKELAAAALARGKDAVKAAQEQARQALLDVEKQADDRIAADTQRIRAETKAAMDELKSRAEARLGEAAEKIVERIVNGS